MILSEEPKIFSTSFLMGGLGNQMFQISHALCQGWRNDIPTIFKCESFTPMQANQPTKYVDNIYRNINFMNFNSRTRRVNAPWEYVNLMVNWDSPVEFHGYFQSSKNFYGFGDRLFDLFRPTEEFTQKIYKNFPEIKKENTVSIHVRRGDYLSIGAILPTIDKSYIDECLNRIGNYDHIFIFSDDVNWAKENLIYENSTIVDSLEDYEDLWFISLCKINIMSNSSFSWWGVFLNKNENKQVYVPSVWFGPNGERNYSDIYEKNWFKINVKYENNKLVYEN
jgi:hypothetical protein